MVSHTPLGVGDGGRGGLPRRFCPVVLGVVVATMGLPYLSKYLDADAVGRPVLVESIPGLHPLGRPRGRLPVDGTVGVA